MRSRVFPIVALILYPVAGVSQQSNWNAPFPAHRVMDTLYYVGTQMLATCRLKARATVLQAEPPLKDQHRTVRVGYPELSILEGCGNADTDRKGSKDEQG